jgi:hypothetical protein
MRWIWISATSTLLQWSYHLIQWHHNFLYCSQLQIYYSILLLLLHLFKELTCLHWFWWHYIQQSYTASKLHMLKYFVHADLCTVFCMQFVDIFIIYLYTKFYIPKYQQCQIFNTIIAHFYFFPLSTNHVNPMKKTDWIEIWCNMKSTW